MNEKCKQHIDSCRFCWMCRHICPIGNATGLERNNARARALGLSLVNRGTYDLSEVIDNVFECACCDACTKECVTGWDPVMFIKEARKDAALNGKLPDYINELVDNCLETGNAYGKKDIDASLRSEISKHEKKTDTLLFLGTDARYMASECAIKAIKAAETTNIEFTLLDDEPASGNQLDYLVGSLEETREAAVSCAVKLNGFDRVIAYDPQDAVMFKRTFKELGVELKPEVITFTEFASQNIKNAVKTDKHAVFQDPFELARELNETEEGRKAAENFVTVDEMLMHGKDTMWAGNILMTKWMEKVIPEIAARRINDAKGVKANMIVTASVSEYTALKSVKQDEVKIVSLEELMLGEV